MSDAVRFYVDEHFSTAVIERLRQHGADVLTADEADRRSFEDLDQLRFATVEKRCIISFDDDYLRLDREFQSRSEVHGGIVYCLPARYEYYPTRLGDDLLVLFELMTSTEMWNKLEYLK